MWYENKAKEITLRVVCLICMAIGAIAALYVLSLESLDSVEQTCLGGITLGLSMLIGHGFIWLFSDECGCLGLDPIDYLKDKFNTGTYNRNLCQETSIRGFRQSYYDSKDEHESARQREERCIQKMIDEIEEMTK